MSEEYYAATVSDAPSSGMAIAGLIASILGITVVPTIGSIIGLILSYVARNNIRESDGEIGGEGIARCGASISPPQPGQQTLTLPGRSGTSNSARQSGQLMVLIVRVPLSRAAFRWTTRCGCRVREG